MGELRDSARTMPSKNTGGSKLSVKKVYIAEGSIYLRSKGGENQTGYLNLSKGYFKVDEDGDAVVPVTKIYGAPIRLLGNTWFMATSLKWNCGSFAPNFVIEDVLLEPIGKMKNTAAKGNRPQGKWVSWCRAGIPSPIFVYLMDKFSKHTGDIELKAGVKWEERGGYFWGTITLDSDVNKTAKMYYNKQEITMTSFASMLASKKQSAVGRAAMVLSANNSVTDQQKKKGKIPPFMNIQFKLMMYKSDRLTAVKGPALSGDCMMESDGDYDELGGDSSDDDASDDEIDDDEDESENSSDDDSDSDDEEPVKEVKPKKKDKKEKKKKKGKDGAGGEGEDDNCDTEASLLEQMNALKLKMALVEQTNNTESPKEVKREVYITEALGQINYYLDPSCEESISDESISKWLSIADVVQEDSLSDAIIRLAELKDFNISDYSPDEEYSASIASSLANEQASSDVKDC